MNDTKLFCDLESFEEFSLLELVQLDICDAASVAKLEELQVGESVELENGITFERYN